MDWNSQSNSVIIKEIGKRIKGYRIRKKMTQQEVAERAGISLYTVAQIEQGKSVSLSMLVPVLRVLRLLDNLELLLPEMGPSPIEMMKRAGKIPQRVRPARKDDEQRS